MSDHTPNTTGPTLEQLLEDAVFADPDPRIQRLKALWEETKAEAARLFQAGCDEYLRQCREYHAAQQTPDGEEVARAEASALRQLLIEQREARLTAIWNETLTQVNAVLAEKKQAPESA